MFFHHWCSARLQVFSINSLQLLLFNPLSFIAAYGCWFFSSCNIKVPMKRNFLFDIFVDKGLKSRFLLLKLNIAPFNNSKISVKPDKSYATNSTWL